MGGSESEYIKKMEVASTITIVTFLTRSNGSVEDSRNPRLSSVEKFKYQCFYEFPPRFGV